MTHGLVYDMCESKKREGVVRSLFDDALETVGEGLDRLALMQRAVAMPKVNNSQTVHTMVFCPQEGKVWFTFDNSYSAGNELVEFSAEELWG